MKKLTILFALLFALPSFAEEVAKAEGETSVKVEDAKRGLKKPSKNDIDKEITNARLRAESGSKSKFSLSTDIGYTGGSINRAFGRGRPNLNGNPENQVNASIDGSAKARYRFTKNDSMTVGTGIQIRTPLQGDVDAQNRQVFVENPRVGYERIYKIGRFATMTGAEYRYGTSFEWTEAKLGNGTLVDLKSFVQLKHNMQTALLDNKLTLGGSVYYINYQYGNGAFDGDPRTAWDLALYPYLEYAFNETYSFRTVFGYFSFEHTRDRSNATLFNMDKVKAYQSVGLGISLTRDVYLYPNIQFLPEDASFKNTNVALSTYINAF